MIVSADSREACARRNGCARSAYRPPIVPRTTPIAPRPMQEVLVFRRPAIAGIAPGGLIIVSSQVSHWFAILAQI
jgi:hypothetical protein